MSSKITTSDLSNTDGCREPSPYLLLGSLSNFLEDNVLEAASPADAERESRARAIDSAPVCRAGLVNKERASKDMSTKLTINTHFGFGFSAEVEMTFEG